MCIDNSIIRNYNKDNAITIDRYNKHLSCNTEHGSLCVCNWFGDFIITRFRVPVNIIAYLSQLKITNVNKRGGYNDNFVSCGDRKAAQASRNDPEGACRKDQVRLQQCAIIYQRQFRK